MALSIEPFCAFSDVPFHERTATSNPNIPLFWLRGNLTRLRGGKRGKLESRIIQFSSSSLGCPFREHAIEIRMPNGFDQQGVLSPLVLDEVQTLCSHHDVAWLMASHSGRGPSIPELLARLRPTYVDLSRVFISDELLRSRLPLPSGLKLCELSRGMILGAEQEEHREFIWRTLSSWQKAAYYGTVYGP